MLCKWLSGFECNQDTNCYYWTWRPSSGDTKPTCALSTTWYGSQSVDGTFSGGRNCYEEGNEHFFPLFLTKSSKIHWKHAPNLRPSTFTATFDSNLPI